MYIPTSKNYFGGAGLLDIGFKNADINTLSTLELDSTCCETLALNFDHTIDNRDICKATVLDQEYSDIMSFTYPCTRYSTIADIHGTRTGDELFLHALRHIIIGKPEAYVIENVPGMKKFPVVMEAMSKLPNYYIQVFCPVDASLWLPQHRERLIIIATKRRFVVKPPNPKYRVRLKDIIEEVPDMEIPFAVEQRLNGVYRDKPIITDPSDLNAIAPTCLSHYAKDRSTRLVVDRSHPMGVRPYTVREFARLQGVPDWFQFSGSDNDAMRQIGNGVAIPVGEWAGNELKRYFNLRKTKPQTNHV